MTIYENVRINTLNFFKNRESEFLVEVNIQDKSRYRRKSYAISRFLAKIISVPISPKMPNIADFFEISITNYFVGVTNDLIFKIEFLKFTLFNFYLIAFCGVINSTHFGDSLHLNILENTL